MSPVREFPPWGYRKMQAGLFWFVVILLVATKLVLVSDLSVTIGYSPHDDSLYVERAFSMLSGQGFGVYDSRVLVKYPGLSIWLAGARMIGLPFLLSVNLVYVAAGVYILLAFTQCGVSRGIALLAFCLLLFNPITLSVEWTRVIREPLGVGIFVALTASMLHISAGISSGRRTGIHWAIFSLAFAFSVYLREDDRLLWGLLTGFVAAVLWQSKRRDGDYSAIRKASLIAVLLAPIVTTLLYDAAIRNFLERHYGLPILHEYSEGEYPRFMATLRAIDSLKDNRMVMVSQQTLQQLRTTVPSLVPLIDQLPPPGSATHSCRLHGVCSEWANGWMPFWIRDAAFRAGLTPTLPEAQAYFRNARLDIERACQNGGLKCTPRGNALVPPMELRWVRAYVAEAWRLAKMALLPFPNVVVEQQAIYDVPVELGRKFQWVTMTSHFDTERQANFVRRSVLPEYVSPLAAVRLLIATPYQIAACILLLVFMPILAWRNWIAHLKPLTPLATITTVVVLYFVARFVILGYVAVFMGAFDPRMMFSTHTTAVLLALPFIYESFKSNKENNA